MAGSSVISAGEVDQPLAYKAVDVYRRKIFPISKSELFRLIKKGELDSFTIGRSRYIRRQDLEEFMARRIAEQRRQSA